MLYMRPLMITNQLNQQCFTILWQDAVPALQVLNADGKWIDAIPMPGTLVVKYAFDHILAFMLWIIALTIK